MDNMFLINIDIAGKKYPLPIRREEEELVRAAAAQINKKVLQYQTAYPGIVDVRDLLAFVAIQLSITNLKLESKNDTGPFIDKMQQLNGELEEYLK